MTSEERSTPETSADTAFADGDVTSDVSVRPIDDANDGNIADSDVRGSDVTPATIDVGVHDEEQPPPSPGWR